MGEFMMTFLLVFTVLRTTVNFDLKYSSMACFAIGLAVFLGHSFLIPIDGCSINPTSCCPQLTVNIALVLPSKMSGTIDAKTIDLDWVQDHPTGSVKPDVGTV